MKRRHSWDGDQQPMMKMHYSEKDEAVKSGAMESVYRKTLQMLCTEANMLTVRTGDVMASWAVKRSRLRMLPSLLMSMGSLPRKGMHLISRRAW